MTNENNPHGLDPKLLEAINKDRKNRRIWTGVVLGFLLVTVLCGVLFFTVGKKLINGMVTGYENSTELIDGFFTAMADKDIETVQGLLSKQGNENYTSATLEELFDSVNFAAFDGYQDFTIMNFSSKTSTGRGTYQEISGIINYEHDFSGEFYIYLQKESGDWKITLYQIDVSPEKVEHYLEHNAHE